MTANRLPKVDYSKCTGCGLCAKNCPEQYVSLDTLVPVVDLTKCTSCGTCAEKCPSKVFKIIQRDILEKKRCIPKILFHSQTGCTSKY
jgi:ferredoxin